MKSASTLLLGTRKGLIVYKKNPSGWEFSAEHFPGIPVSYAIEDPRNGNWWACLDHGHWGCKLQFSSDQGANWKELESPKYPEGEWIKEGVPASTKYLWVLEPGHASRPEEIFIPDMHQDLKKYLLAQIREDYFSVKVRVKSLS